MNKFELWVLRKIAKKVVIQGSHRRMITDFYAVLIEAARVEFSEDYVSTLDIFLADRHLDALNKNTSK